MAIFDRATSITTTLSDSANWQKNVHSVVLKKNFKTMKEAIEFSIEKDVEYAKDDATSREAINKILDNLPKEYSKPNYSDSSLGGNDAINCYWSFGEDDDIVPEINDYANQSIGDIQKPSDGTKGMGRVYHKVYELNQQILWLRFGVPEYSGLRNFYLGNANSSLAGLMSKGIGFSLGDLLGRGIALAFKLPFLPLIWMNDVLKSTNVTEINKFYGFRNTMVIYYRMVNVLMSHLAVGMGIFKTGVSKNQQTGGVNENDYGSQYADAGIPEILKHGPDIYTIMDKRARRMNPSNGIKKTDDYTKMLKDEGWFSKFFSSVKNTAIGGTDFIGLRIEKSTDSSESFSNNIGESSLAGRLNGRASESRDKMFSGQGGKLGIPGLDTAVDFIKGAAGGLADGFGLSGLLNTVTGAGFYDIGEVWKSSSFSKSYTFNIALRSLYGDPISIYQSIYVPLAILLAAGCPRSIGSNMYTSPFIINAYCKGMFAIPCGMIESMTIKRGLPEFGWNVTNLPTAVDVSITIKDMTPTMHISLADGGFLDIFRRNDNMHEYLTTLSAVGLQERYYGLDRMRRKTDAALLIHKNTTGSPLYWGNKIGNSSIVRLISNFAPSSRLAKN